LFVLQPRLAAISGVVSRDDTGEPLEGARIDVAGSGQWHAFSDQDGHYIIDAAVGEYQVSVSLAGFPDQIESAVATMAGAQTSVDFALVTPPGTLDVSPIAHHFGAIDNHQISPPLEVTVNNVASEPARVLDLAGLEISGDAPFDIGAAGTCDTQTALAPLESCTLEVFFAPVVSGNYQAAVEIATTDQQSATINVTGTGLPIVPADLVIEPSTLEFDETFAGGNRFEILTVTNAAEGDAMSLVLTQLEVIAGTSSFTSDTGTCKPGLALAPGHSCTMVIQFNPSAASAYTGVFRVGVEGQHRNIGLSGRGVDPPPDIFEDRFEGPASQEDHLISDTGPSNLDIE
jgi:hypothetical protein